MREYIRWWITEWDLKRLFPEYQPEIEATPLTFDYTEDAELQESDADDPNGDRPDETRDGWSGADSSPSWGEGAAGRSVADARSGAPH
jgi:hypothetical protein